MMKKYVFYGLLLWICLSPATLLAGKTVTATGMSFFEPGREVIARERALAEAKRAAIEQAIGASIDSHTVVEDFQVVKDRIFSRSTGYLSDLKILEENRTDLGTYEVKIQAMVEMADLVNDLDRFRRIFQWQKNPRISIEIEPGLAKDYLPAARKTANLLTARLKQDGFSVFRYTKGGELEIGLMVALNLEHASRQTAFRDLTLTLNEISLTANIYRPGEGEIIAAAGAVKSLPGENRLKTLDTGARLCVEAIWSELRKKLSMLWEKELFSERNVFLLVKNVPSHGRAEDIRLIFESDLSGVLGADLVALNGSVAEYHLKYRGWAEHLLNEMQMSYFRNKYFDVDLEGMTANRLVIRIK